MHSSVQEYVQQQYALLPKMERKLNIHQQNRFCSCIKLNTIQLENAIPPQQHKLRGKEQCGEIGNVVNGLILHGLGRYSEETGFFDPADDKGTDRCYRGE